MNVLLEQSRSKSAFIDKLKLAFQMQDAQSSIADSSLMRNLILLATSESLTSSIENMDMTRYEFMELLEVFV